VPKQATPPLHLHPLPPLAPVDGIGPGVGLAFVRAYFPLVQGSLRIATAYFSLKGYTMAFTYLPQGARVRLKILVGKRDGYQVERTVLEDLRAELRQGVKLATLYEAVADLYRRMEAGELTICDARQMERPFHCKFYLIDAAGVFHGSANFSLNGLKGQAEQLTYSTDTNRVADWTAWFEKVAAGATDLHAELRKLLAEWLKMATPFQVYLRALELLLTPMRELNHKAGAHSPVPYQRTLAAWAERQLIAHKGAILVVATGLGKTIIGAETVGQLWRAGRIERVLVLAPPLVHKTWSNELKGRGLQKGRHYEQFGLKALFRAEPVPGGQTARLLEELNQANSGTLILVDEAHEYRNQQQATQAKLLNKTKRRDKASSGSLVFDRLKSALAAGAQVLLLTGSAYGTSRLNLSSLLRLLPPTAPIAPAAEATELELQITVPTEPPYWTASTPADFGLLPVVAVFTYPHALYLARLEQPGATSAPGEISQPPFLPFAHVPGYLPLGIHSEPVYYSPPHWQEILTAFDRGCFAQEVPITTEGYTDETGPIIGKTDVVNKQALAAWLSSPAALRETIEHNLATVGPALTKQGTLPLLFNLDDSTSAQTATPTPNVSRQLPLWEADEVPATTQKQRNSKTSKRPKNASYNTNLRLTQEERQRQLAPIQALLQAGIEEDPKFKVLYEVV
jgi:hypothetical protein